MTTSINQTLLITESGAFFLHALGRSAFRLETEVLREVLYDPIAFAWAEFLCELLLKQGITASSADVLTHVAMRDFEFGAAPSLLGTSATDEGCALWSAAVVIAEAIAGVHPVIAANKARLLLLQSLLVFNFPQRVETASALSR